MIKSSKNPHIGSSLDDFLGEQGIIEECEQQAIREMLADQVRQAMADNKLSKTAMAERMKTGGRQHARLAASFRFP